MSAAPVVVAIDAEIIRVERKLRELRALRERAIEVVGGEEAAPAKRTRRTPEWVRQAAADRRGGVSAELMDEVAGQLHAAGPDGLSMPELVAKTGRSQSTVSRVIRRMCAQDPPVIRDSGETRPGSNGGRAAVIWGLIEHLDPQPDEDRVRSDTPEAPEPVPAMSTANGDEPLSERIFDSLCAGARLGLIAIANEAHAEPKHVRAELEAMAERGEIGYDGTAYWLQEVA